LRQKHFRVQIPGPFNKRRVFVIKQLKDSNRKLSGRLLERLRRKKDHRLEKAQDHPPRSLWLANSIAITATSDDIRDLMDDPTVAEVIPNMILSIPPIITGYMENSEEFTNLWNHEAIGLDFLRRQGIDGSGVRIGLLDTGLDTSHPEIIDKLVGWQEFDGFGNPVVSQPHETHDKAHGTYVASIMVGDSVGLAPGAELMAALVLPGGYGTVEQVLAGMQWIMDPDGDPETDDGAQIVNMSWGLDGTVNVLKEAVEVMRNAGILPVGAIGNNGRDSTFSPGNAPGAIAVGAMNEYDNIAVFSGGGEVCWENLCLTKPDLSAPGTKVYGAGLWGDYQSLSGTSVAAPHVAGAAALLWQYKASLALPRLQRFLLHSASDLGSWGMDARFGWGLLDIPSAAGFIDSYANRIGSADLVIEKTKKMSRGNVYRYYTYFSDGEAEFLTDESDFLTLPPAPGPSAVEPAGMGDVDGDGFSDLIIRNTIPIDQEVSAINWEVYPSMGAHGFSAIGRTWYTIESAHPEAYRLIGVADTDGDQRSDLLLSRVESSNWSEEHHIFALLSTGTRFVLPPENEWARIKTSSFYRYHFGTGDVNNDGRSDLILTKTFDDPYYVRPTLCYVGLSESDGFSPLAFWLFMDPVYPYQQIDRFFIRDVNGDGHDDLIFLQGSDYWSGTEMFVYACLSNGTNHFLHPKKWTEIDTEQFAIAETLADVNGDKAYDLVVRYHNLEMDTNAIHVWLADGQNEVFIPTETAWFKDPYGVLSGEFKVVGVTNVGLGAW
jgi:subtilisin family serine protease